jgi:hypothetical protein
MADMTKKDFVKRWAKKAAGGGAVETFENDVERLVRTIVLVSTSSIVNGLLTGLEESPKDQKRFVALVNQISPAVEQALQKLYE